MSSNISNLIWLGEVEVCTIDHLVETSGLSLNEVEDLIVSGAIWPAEAFAQPRRFHLMHVMTARQARTLRDDFELDINGVALAMTLLRRINTLEQALSLRLHGGAGN